MTDSDKFRSAGVAISKTDARRSTTNRQGGGDYFDFT
jgi:hypothetical protein